jgi:hypothetical protein
MAMAAGLLLASPPATAGDDEAAPGQVLTGQASRSVLPAEPARLGWEAPGGTLWARGEASLGGADAEAEAGFERGAVDIGAKQELAILPNLSWSVAPQLRLESAGDPHGLPAAPALNGTVQQDLALSLPGETRLAASVGLGDRIGMGFLAAPAASQPGATLRSRVSLSVQPKLAGRPMQAEFQLTSTRPLAPDHGPTRPNSCELALVLRWGGTAPLRLAGSCPGEAVQRVTLGISATF